jgi:RNA polymerase sigma-70 factor (ECF subfamily)
MNNTPYNYKAVTSLWCIMTEQVAALKNDSRECFNEVYDSHHTKLYQYIYSRTQSSYLAQEVVQLTFIKLWETRSRLADELPIDIQLFRIAKTTLIDELRKESVKLKYNNQVSNAAEVFYEDNQLTDKDTLTHVYAAMENLPAMRKKVFKLSRVHGFTYKQIAGILSISPKTVEHHISKAIKQLRNSIKMFFFL